MYKFPCAMPYLSEYLKISISDGIYIRCEYSLFVECGQDGILNSDLDFIYINDLHRVLTK